MFLHFDGRESWDSLGKLQAPPEPHFFPLPDPPPGPYFGTLFRDPISGPYFGGPFWDHFLGPKFGTRFGTTFGPRFGTTFLGPKFGTRFGTTFWTSFRDHFLDPNFDPVLDLVLARNPPGTLPKPSRNPSKPCFGENRDEKLVFLQKNTKKRVSDAFSSFSVDGGGPFFHFFHVFFTFFHFFRDFFAPECVKNRTPVLPTK